MNLSPTELLTMAGLLRVVLRFDALDERARRDALADVVHALELRREEIERADHDRSGYRDAAIVVRRIAIELEPWLARAAREVASEEELRELVEHAVPSVEARRAILRALHTFAGHGTLDAREELFVAWLSLFWREAPPEVAASGASFKDLASLPATDKVILAGLITHALELSGLDAEGRERALDAGLRGTSLSARDLGFWTDRARVEIRSAAHLRALAAFGVTSPRSREAILRALLAVTREGGLTEDEQTFLVWLARTWAMI